MEHLNNAKLSSLKDKIIEQLTQAKIDKDKEEKEKLESLHKLKGRVQKSKENNDE